MLSRELMGLFALGVLWLNTGLVLAVAWQQLRRLSALSRELRAARGRGELVHGTARADGRFAVRRIHQTGRAITTKGPERVLFTDGPQSFDVLGGALEHEGERLEVPATRPGEAEVWIDRERAAEALSCASPAAFEEAYDAGSKFKGYTREAELEVRGDEAVWVYGRRDGARLVPWEERPLVVATMDPVRWIEGARARAIRFLVLGALGLVAVTTVALWPPPFGLVSTIGGALCLAYFLAIQPLGTALRDAIKTPARRQEGALWERPSA